MKILKKSFCILILLISILLISSSNISYASIQDIKNGANIFMDSSSDDKQIFNETNQENAVTSFYWLFLGIGFALVVIIGVILGIQFITNGVEGKAKVKEKLIPYAIGSIVIFGAFGIWAIVLKVTQNVIK